MRIAAVGIVALVATTGTANAQCTACGTNPEPAEQAQRACQFTEVSRTVGERIVTLPSTGYDQAGVWDDVTLEVWRSPAGGWAIVAYQPATSRTCVMAAGLGSEINVVGALLEGTAP